MVVENLSTIIYSEVFSLMLMESIVDLNTDETAIGVVDTFFVTSNGQRRLKNTIIGWKMEDESALERLIVFMGSS